MNSIKHWILPCILVMGLPAAAMAQSPKAETAPEQPEAAVTKETLSEAFKAEQWGRSAEIARELLKTEPDNADYLSVLGVSCFNNSDKECAKDAFEKFHALKPDDAQVYANLCAVYSEIDIDSHLDTCLEAAKRNPQNAQLLYLTGQKLERAKKLSEAREMYEKAWKIEPKNNIFLTAVTAIDFARTDYKTALEITEEGIKNGEPIPILYLNAILAANRVGDYDKAIQYADKGYETYKDALMLLGKSEALDRQGKYEAAEPIWNDLRVSLANNGMAKERLEAGLARHLLAMSCTSDSYKTCKTPTPDACCAREGEILQHLEAVAPENQDNDYFVMLGLAQTLAGQLEKAEATLTKAVNANMDRDNASALAALSAALYQYDDERDKNAAKRYYTQAVNASPDFSNFDQLNKMRAWPPRLVDTLRQIQADTSQGSKKKAAGCGCDIAQNPTTPWGAFVLLLLAFAAIGAKKFRLKS